MTIYYSHSVIYQSYGNIFGLFLVVSCKIQLYFSKLKQWRKDNQQSHARILFLAYEHVCKKILNLLALLNFKLLVPATLFSLLRLF